MSLSLVSGNCLSEKGLILMRFGVRKIAVAKVIANGIVKCICSCHDGIQLSHDGSFLSLEVNRL